MQCRPCPVNLSHLAALACISFLALPCASLGKTIIAKNLGRVPLGTIAGDLDIYGGSQAGIYRDQTISASSIVTFKYASNQRFAPTLYFATYPVNQHIHKVIVEESGVFSFGAHEVSGHRFLFMDDLVIAPSSEFTISWYFSDTHLLLRKDSKHLSESLSRIRFSQNPSKRAGIREYNADYYEIGPGFPEPATYGASLSAAGLVLWFCRRRKLAAGTASDDAPTSRKLTTKT